MIYDLTKKQIIDNAEPAEQIKYSIGAKVDLDVRIVDAAGKVVDAKKAEIVQDSVRWIMPENAIKDYVVEVTKSELQELDDSDLAKVNLKFYWRKAMAETQLEVSTKYKVSNRQGKMGGTLGPAKPFGKVQVVNPEWRVIAEQLTNLEPKVQVLSVAGISKAVLRIGEIVDPRSFDPKAGYTFKFAANSPVARGEIGLIQLLKAEVKLFDKRNEEDDHFTTNGYVLDHIRDEARVVYNVETLVANQEGVVKFSDSPAIVWNQTDFEKISLNDQFRTYIVFRPENGIWAPIAKTTWNWSGAAKQSGAVWAKVDPGTSSEAAFSGFLETNEFPEWSNDWIEFAREVERRILHM